MKTNTLPVILWQDSAKIEDMKSSLDNLIQVAQDVVNRFYEMNLPGTEKIDLYSILNNSEALIQQQIRSQIPSSLEIAGLKLNKEKVLSAGFYDLPGRESFIEALNRFKTNPGFGLQDYLTLENKTVSINPEIFDTFKSRLQTIASTPEELDLVKEWRSMVEKLNTFEDLVNERYHVRLRRKLEFINFEKWFLVNDGNKLTINHNMFKELTRKKFTRVQL
jgi:hypothetical protein